MHKFLFDIKKWGVLFIPLFFYSCSMYNTKLDRGIAIRAVDAAKQAEFSKCASATQSYIEARRDLELAERFYANPGNWEEAEKYYASARSLAEKAEEDDVFCATK